MGQKPSAGFLSLIFLLRYLCAMIDNGIPKRHFPFGIPFMHKQKKSR